VKKTLAMLSDTSYRTHAEQILKSGWVRPNKRIFNNAKVFGQLRHHPHNRGAETFE